MARKGLPKSIIKKYGISKKAWAVFRGRKSSKSSNPRPEKARKVKNVARRKYSRKRKRRSRGMTIPLAPVIGLIGPMAPRIIPSLIRGDFGGALHEARNIYTGFDEHGNFHFEWLMQGIMPLIGGLLVHKFVGGAPLNANRILANANVPFIRI